MFDQANEGTVVNCYSFTTPHPDYDQMTTEKGFVINSRPQKGSTVTRLLCGDIEKAKHGKILLLDRPQEDGATLLLVETKAGVLSHNGRSVPHLRYSNTWIGADGPGLLYHRGKWNDPTKRQLFRLVPKQSILFFDAAREVTKLTAGSCGQEPQRSRARDDEVADYVLEEAFKRGTGNRNTRTWCLRTLEELGCTPQLKAFQEKFKPLSLH